MCGRRTYNNTFAQMLRAFRNKKHHYHELTPELKALVGSMPHGYFDYFHTRFPSLFISCYRFIRDRWGFVVACLIA
jgi:serine/threonine-protein kinase/endoribonuclease IRE1